MRKIGLAQVQNDEPLREILRRTLRAFIHLLANPSDEWTVQRVAKDPDPVLLHSERRSVLQGAMDVLLDDNKRCEIGDVAIAAEPGVGPDGD